MRKAFLDLDRNYSGYINAEDISCYFGSNGNDKLDFKTIKLLLQQKISDSKKHQKQKGYLDYTDFSKWAGSCIEPSEGFYFRHDSILNPEMRKNKLQSTLR